MYTEVTSSVVGSLEQRQLSAWAVTLTPGSERFRLIVQGSTVSE